MYYKILNENTITKAPSILKIDGKSVYTNDEKIYNNEGYYKLKIEDKADGDYIPKYFLQNKIIVQKWSPNPVKINQYWEDANSHKETFNDEIEAYREKILSAWDIYSKNVAYGIIKESDAEHEYYVKWYKAICDKELWAFETIPAEIKKHMR